MAQLPKDVLEQKNQNWNNIKNKRQGDARQPPILIDDSGMKPKQPPILIDDSGMNPKQPPILIDDSGMKPKQPPILIDDSGMKPKEQSPTFSGDHRYRGEMGTPKPAINVFPSGK